MLETFEYIVNKKGCYIMLNIDFNVLNFFNSLNGADG